MKMKNDYRTRNAIIENQKNFKMSSSASTMMDKTANTRKQYKFTQILPDFLKWLAKLVCFMVLCELIEEILYTS